MKRKLKRKTVLLPLHQDAFIKKKTAELRRLAPIGEEDKITESGVIQGLIDWWMAHDARRKPRQ